jgi:hypothetical protein
VLAPPTSLGFANRPQLVLPELEAARVGWHAFAICQKADQLDQGEQVNVARAGNRSGQYCMYQSVSTGVATVFAAHSC